MVAMSELAAVVGVLTGIAEAFQREGTCSFTGAEVANHLLQARNLIAKNHASDRTSFRWRPIVSATSDMTWVKPRTPEQEAVVASFPEDLMLAAMHGAVRSLVEKFRQMEADMTSDDVADLLEQVLELMDGTGPEHS